MNTETAVIALPEIPRLSAPESPARRRGGLGLLGLFAFLPAPLRALAAYLLATLLLLAAGVCATLAREEPSVDGPRAAIFPAEDRAADRSGPAAPTRPMLPWADLGERILLDREENSAILGKPETDEASPAPEPSPAAPRPARREAGPESPDVGDSLERLARAAASANGGASAAAPAAAYEASRPRRLALSSGLGGLGGAWQPRFGKRALARRAFRALPQADAAAGTADRRSIEPDPGSSGGALAQLFGMAPASPGDLSADRRDPWPTLARAPMAAVPPVGEASQVPPWRRSPPSPRRASGIGSLP